MGKAWVAALSGLFCAAAVRATPPRGPDASAVPTDARPGLETAARCPDDMVFVPARSLKTREGETVVWRALCIDTFEVTVGAFRECVRAEHCSPAEKACRRWRKGQERLPMECASVAQALDFCRFRKKRLPTVEEWERAAKGGDDTRQDPWGDARLEPGGVCWGRTEKQGPCIVGASLQDVSPVGAYDMGANVREWTFRREEQRLVSDVDYYQHIVGTNWRSQPERPKRGRMGTASPGGAWAAWEARHQRAGFRCARDIEMGSR